MVQPATNFFSNIFLFLPGKACKQEVASLFPREPEKNCHGGDMVRRPEQGPLRAAYIEKKGRGDSYGQDADDWTETLASKSASPWTVSDSDGAGHQRNGWRCMWT